METILKLKTYVDGVNDTPFPNKDSQISTSSFKFDAKRMGSAPTISASIQCTKSMDAYWNYKVYADFNGERFFLKQIPSGTISNERDGFKYDITLVSERSVLENVYFYDVVTTSGNDKPVSNSSIFSFFGDLNEFASRLKRSLQYSGVNYDVVVDSDVRLEPKMVSFQDKYVLDALKDSYGIFKVPFYFVARTIHFGYNDKNNEISEVFRYGDEYSLLSIQKQNTNQPIVTKITGFGSDVNVPYYYPNETARGDLGLNVLSGTNNYRITSMNAFANYVGVGERILYTEGYVENVSDRFSNNGSFYDDYTKPIEFLLTTRVRNIKYKKKFKVITGGFIDIALGIKIDGLYGKTDDYLKAYELYDSEKNNVPITIKDGKAERIWIQETGEYELISYWEFVDDSLNPKPKPEPQPEIASIGSKAAQAGGDKTDNEDSGEPGGHPDEPQDPVDPNDSENYISVEFGILVYTTPYWKNTNSDRVIELNKIGVVCDTTPSVGDSFTQYVVRYIKPAPKLMPSIYRDSLAEDRFYEARNGVYESPNGGTYEFKNTFESNNPKERIVTFDDVKPTIKGMVNAIGERIDIFSAFAFDSDDSDEQEEIDGSLEYKHPYFFAKLRKFDGENGFNLFDQAIENDEMYISFTNGTLGGCKFKIAVSSNDGKSNLVQVDKNGNLVRDDKTGDVICGRKPYQASVKAQEEQNDTSKYEVWIALEKDFETFGTLLPNNYAPSSGSTFVILNILLPNAYIKNAEKELDRKLIEYMSNHNDEKFNFSIDFSRIYLAEHKEILSHLGENSKIRVSYDGNQYDLYTSSFTYEANEDEILPKIRIDLSDSVELYENYVETSIKRSEKTTNNKISKKANRATTTSGYGIRNAVNHVTSNGKGNVITKISVSGNNLNVEYGQPITSDVSDGSSDLFRKVNIGTEEKPEYAIKALFGLYSEQFITAKGHGKDEGGKPSTGGIIKIVYGFKDLGKVFDDKNLTDTFNAFTINAINERLKKVEQGSGIALNLNPLTINVNGNNFVTYNPKEDGKTLNIKAGENISIDTDSLGNVTINAVNTGGGVGEITLADWNRVAQLEGNKYIGDKNNRNYIYIQENVEVQKGFKFTSTPMVGNTNVALVTDIPTIPSLDGYATEQWVLDKKYLTKHQSLDGYATETWVTNQKYLTEHQSLVGYATETWVNNKNYLTSHQTIYGISFNINSLPFLEYVPNSASKNINLVPGDNVGFVVDKSTGKITINATDTIYELPTATSSVKGGVKVGDTLSISNEVLNLKSIISTTGTYTKVTVDTYGRVTSGSTLLEDDIPTLSIGKIDGLKDALDSKLDKNDFDSLFVKEQYGDTFVIKAKFGLYTEQFLSAKGIGGGGSQPIGITKYAQLPDKPSINGIVLEGNKTTEQLGIIVSSGTTDYGDLSNKPKINNKTLVGNMSLDTLGIQPKGNYLTEHQSLEGYALKTDIPSLTGYYTSAKVDELLNGKANAKHTHIIEQITDLQPALDSKLNKSVFDDLFKKVNLGTTEAPKWAICANYGFYSEEFVSAKGVGSGGSQPVGITRYSQLPDKPSINGVTLEGNKTTADLRISVGVSSVHWDNDKEIVGRPIWVKGAKKPTYTYSEVGAAAATHNHVLANITDFDRTSFYYTSAQCQDYTSDDRGATPAAVKKAFTIFEPKAHKHTMAEIEGLSDALNGKLDKSFFDELFEKVNIGTKTSPKYAIRAKLGLYSDQFLSAKGNGGGGSQPVGITRYSQLPDKPSINGVILEGNKTSEQLGLGGAASSVAWDDITGKPTWIGVAKPKYAFSDLTSHPTTIKGYGITNAYTKTECDAYYQPKGSYVETINRIGQGTDCDSVSANAFTHDYIWTNGGGSSIGSVVDLTYSPDWRAQIFFDINSSCNTYIRNRHSGTTWTSWKRIAFASDIPTLDLDSWNAAAQEVGEKYIGNSSNGNYIHIQEDVKVERNCNFSSAIGIGSYSSIFEDETGTLMMKGSDFTLDCMYSGTISGDGITITTGITGLEIDTEECISCQLRYQDSEGNGTSCNINIGYDSLYSTRTTNLGKYSSRWGTIYSNSVNCKSIDGVVDEDFVISTYDSVGDYAGLLKYNSMNSEEYIGSGDGIDSIHMETYTQFHYPIITIFDANGGDWSIDISNSKMYLGQSQNLSISIDVDGNLNVPSDISNSSYMLRAGSNPLLRLSEGGENWYVQVSRGNMYIGGTSSAAVRINSVGELYSPKGIFSDGYVTAKQASDKRLKTNFDYSVDYQEKLLSLGRICDFNYTDEAIERNEGAVDNSRHTGLIWQEAKQVGLNNFSIEDKDGYGALNYLSVDYINTIAGAAQLTILGLRNVKSDVDVLKEKLEKANKRIKELEDKIYEC